MKKIYYMYFITACILILLTACEDPKKLPTASFTLSKNPEEVGQTVYFQNTSKYADTYDWNFGDGNSSTEVNPSHIYTTEGSFNVQLVVTNSAGSDEAIGTIEIIPPQSGKITQRVVHSDGLEGNLLGDSPDRMVNIYLPPGYDYTDKYYPVIYFLHCYSCDHETFFGGSGVQNLNFKTLMDELIQTDEINPMIIVSPNSKNLFEGSYYTNSVVTGDWEDFIVKDVVQYIDDNYRTLAKRESRGIAGYSMGGYGTIKLAMRNPDLFNAAYMLSAACLDFDHYALGPLKSYLIEAVTTTNISGMSLLALGFVAKGAAFAPDPTSPPKYCHLPVNATGELIDSIWQKWLLHDPITILPTFRDSLLQFSAIQFDCGTSDELYLNTSNVTFSSALTQYGIDHVFEEYTGDHQNKIAERIKMKLLPFFSANLVHQDVN